MLWKSLTGKYYKVNVKIKKKLFGNEALTLLKGVFKFLNVIAE